MSQTSTMRTETALVHLVNTNCTMAFIALNTQSGNTGLVTITLTAERKAFTFIIDTGSNVSHIDTAAASLLTKSKKTSLKDDSVIGISGALQSSGKIRQIFRTAIFTFDHEFLVTDLSELAQTIKDTGNIEIHGLLGTDFLSKYRCHLDFKKNRLHLG